MNPIFFTRLNFTGLSQVIVRINSIEATASAHLNIHTGQWEASVRLAPGHEHANLDDLEAVVHEACREARNLRKPILQNTK